MIFQKKHCTSVACSAQGGVQRCVARALYLAVKFSPRTTVKPPLGYSAKSGNSPRKKAVVPSAICFEHWNCPCTRHWKGSCLGN